MCPQSFLLLLGNVYIHPTAKVAPSAVVSSSPTQRKGGREVAIRMGGAVQILPSSGWGVSFVHGL